MQYLSKSQLAAAKTDLRRADAALARTRAIFIAGGYAQGAATINALIDKLAHLRARIDKALMAKP